MKKIAVLMSVLVVMLAVPVQAASWSGNVRVATIEVSNVNLSGVWLSFTTPPYSSHSCSAKNGQYLLGGGTANVDKMTAAANAALVNARVVSVYWGGACSSGGVNGYPVLLGLTLK